MNIVRSPRTSMLYVVLAFVAVLTLEPSSVLSQGSLTPPGAPAPMMKTLQQIEPRTAITNTTAVTISTPGSYYLTTNITVASGNAIIISTNNVTLDLNGFTISSTNPSATGYGIFLSGARANITILNGHIAGNVTQTGGVYSGSGFDTGIGDTGGSLPRNVRVAGVTVSGCQSSGIYVDASGTVVESCTVDTVGYVGIYAQTVSDCSALNCGSLGVDGLTVQNSFGTAVGVDGTGLFAAYTANNCYGTGTSSGSSTDNSYGLYAGDALNSYGVSVNGYGLYAANTANNCYGISTGGVGLNAYAASVCRGDSTNRHGMVCFVAINCIGITANTNAAGISCTVANDCVAYGPGVAIIANTAIGCVPGQGTVSASQKFLGTP